MTLGICKGSCKISVQAASSEIESLDPEICSHCKEPELPDNEDMESDSDGGYEFNQDTSCNEKIEQKKGKTIPKNPTKLLKVWKMVCETFRKIVDSKYFGRGIMIAILINTLSMGIEYHEQVR